MPIRGRTLHEAARIFCDHVNHVLATTVTRMRLVPIRRRDATSVQIAFRQGGRLITAPLRTRFGPMGLYIGQVCESVLTSDGLHELRTVEYKYHLIPDGAREALLRWEYVRTPPTGAHWCRHHLQGPITLLQMDAVMASLNELHLPTGYVSFQEVLRFCIVDLGVPPLAVDWDRTLRESYELFKTEFAQ